MFPVHSWEFFVMAHEAWDAMYRACSDAKESIDLEQFIFYNDTIGGKFGALMIRKAREGKRVRLLVDTVGSFPFVSSTLLNEMREAGVEISYFNYIKPWKISRIKYWLFRDHRKLLIVDKKIAFMGGVGIGDKLGPWRDTQFSIEGPVVAECVEAFEHVWTTNEQDKFVPFKKPRFVSGGFMLVPHAPHFRQRHIRNTYIDALRSARRYAYITTPYFAPDRRLFRVMRLAARRGVDVRLLVPEKGDPAFMDKIADAQFGKALRSKIKIYKYTSRMMHAKTIAIDDDWASVGSCNLDDSSLFFNYEITLISVQAKFVETVKRQFEDDILMSHEYTYDEWKKRSWFQIFLEFYYLYMWRTVFWILKKIFYF